MSDQQNGFNYALPNYAYYLQNLSNFHIPNEEDRINSILKSTNVEYHQLHHFTLPAEVTLNQYAINLNRSPTSSKHLSIISSQIENLNGSTTSSSQESMNSIQKPTSSEFSNICNKFTETYDIYEPREKDLPSIVSISSNHVPSIDRTETNSFEKDKMELAKSYVVSEESLEELDRQQDNNSFSVDVDNLYEVLKNFHLETGSEAENGKKNESFADIEETGQEIISISSIDNDIDFIIFILKRRKQQKAHPTYKPLKLSIIFIRIMTHKLIMCHSIRGW
ncbi:unnamed protein product [Chironomus riparius]|uniref:Uncharacterized protein n=1 Tax=Chironomus riparius TaxID=315576 RepID=A0A9N9X1J5_9DIPT|nr:unnamed protein product [Chironomus riparius]